MILFRRGRLDFYYLGSSSMMFYYLVLEGPPRSPLSFSIFHCLVLEGPTGSSIVFPYLLLSYLGVAEWLSLVQDGFPFSSTILFVSAPMSCIISTHLVLQGQAWPVIILTRCPFGSDVVLNRCQCGADMELMLFWLGASFGAMGLCRHLVLNMFWKLGCSQWF